MRVIVSILPDKKVLITIPVNINECWSRIITRFNHVLLQEIIFYVGEVGELIRARVLIKPKGLHKIIIELFASIKVR